MYPRICSIWPTPRVLGLALAGVLALCVPEGGLKVNGESLVEGHVWIKPGRSLFFYFSSPLTYLRRLLSNYFWPPSWSILTLQDGVADV